jgi:hypothetical protein
LEVAATERDAAARAEQLRREVAALEHQTLIREAQAARAQQQQQQQKLQQRTVEAERCVIAPDCPRLHLIATIDCP